MARADRRALDALWADRLGVAPDTLAQRGTTVVPRPEPGKRHVVVFRTDTHAILLVPPSLQGVVEGIAFARPGEALSAAELRAALPDVPLEAANTDLILYLDPARVGDAWDGDGRICTLTPDDAPALAALLQAATAREGQLANVQLGHLVALGFFEVGQLRGAASLIDEDGVVDVGVLTHPGARGCGIGTRLVRALAALGTRTGKWVQYTSMENNVASVRVAAAVGFERYAVEEWLRLKS